MPTLPYDALLDAGDRLVAALAAGDLAAAARVLDERDWLLGDIDRATLEPPPAALIARFRDQGETLRQVLARETAALADALATTSRAAAAPARYATLAHTSVVDTAPR